MVLRLPVFSRWRYGAAAGRACASVQAAAGTLQCIRQTTHAAQTVNGLGLLTLYLREVVTLYEGAGPDADYAPMVTSMLVTWPSSRWRWDARLI